MIRALILLLALTACARPIDAGCAAYGEARLTLPRPLATGPLPDWIAGLDDRMTAACR